MSNRRLYVGNLPYSFDNDALRALFGTHGELTDVHVAQDRETGRSRGFGFVSYAESDAALAAVEALNGHSIEGRALVVNVARERGAGGPPPRPSGGPPRPGGSAGGPPPRRPPGASGGPPSRPPMSRGPGAAPDPGLGEGEEPKRIRAPRKKKPIRERERSPRPRPSEEEDARRGSAGSWRQWLEDPDEE